MLIRILYLKGISTGDFEEALVALLGKEAIPWPRGAGRATKLRQPEIVACDTS